MLFFRKKVTRTPDLSWLGADMHAHLLPGIDDGAADLNDSLELISALADLGYQKLIATPHILWDMYPNTPEIIAARLAEVQADLPASGLQLQLGAAAEYFIDDHFMELVERKEPLLTIGGKMVLVEFSMVTAPYELQQVFFEMQVQGYQPVLAHPERYIYLGRNKAVFEQLHDAGVYFQLNLMSLAGQYGRTAQELANHLLEKGYYQFAGTDLHNVRQLDALRKLAASPLVDQLRAYPFRNQELLG